MLYVEGVIRVMAGPLDLQRYQCLFPAIVEGKIKSIRSSPVLIPIPLTHVFLEGTRNPRGIFKHALCRGRIPTIAQNFSCVLVGATHLAEETLAVHNGFIPSSVTCDIVRIPLSSWKQPMVVMLLGPIGFVPKG